MKTPIFLFFFLCGNLAMGQNLVRDTALLQVRARLNFDDNTVSILSFQSSGQAKLGQRPQIAVQAGEVNITYIFPERNGVYDLKVMEIRQGSTGQVFPLKEEYIYYRLEGLDRKRQDASMVITLANTPDNDNLKWLSGEISLTLAVSRLYADDPGLDCGSPPILTTKDFTPDIIVGGVGAVVLGVGLALDQRSDKLYKEYESKSTREEGEEIYYDANRKHQEAWVTTAIGIGLLSTGAILALRRYGKHKRDKKYYNKYCAGLSLQPQYNIQRSPAGSIGQFGIKLNFNF